MGVGIATGDGSSVAVAGGTAGGSGAGNIGCGDDITIRELAELVKSVVGYDGALVFDTSKPDGTPRKLMDVSRMTALGWKPKIGMVEGLEEAYADFQKAYVAHAVREG